MKKFKNLVIGGIETKIFNLILITVVLLAAAFFLVSTNRTVMLSRLTAETSARQQESISEITGAVMDQVVQDRKDQPISSIVRALHDEALEIRDEDVRVCRMIGKYGLTLVKPGDGLLTHCNAGKLAAIRYGTATAPMYLGHEQGYNFKIYCAGLNLIPALICARTSCDFICAPGY